MSRPGFTLQCVIDGHRDLQWDEAEFRAKARRLRPGVYTLTIEQYVEQRTQEQNAYLHSGPFPMLMDEWGYDTMEELKWALMGACWGWKRLPDGREVPVRPHTSQMNVDECRFFIDWLLPFAAKQGVILEPPKKKQAQTA